MSDENPHQLDDLQRRINELKAGSDAFPVPPSESEQAENAEDRKGLSAAYEMIMTPIVCGGLGLGLDHMLSTKPVFFISLAFLGVCAGFWRLYKVSQNIQTPLELKRLQDKQKQDRKTPISE
jgi:F0F1-type ATP synthase assembly protein I